jgi:hypothetical protein
MRTLRLVEIAELLGVTKQRAHQIADDKGFPAPLVKDARGASSGCRTQGSQWASRSTSRAISRTDRFSVSTT